MSNNVDVGAPTQRTIATQRCRLHQFRRSGWAIRRHSRPDLHPSSPAAPLTVAALPRRCSYALQSLGPGSGLGPTIATSSKPTVVERRAADVAVLGDSCVALCAALSLARRGKKVVWLPHLGLNPTPAPAGAGAAGAGAAAGASSPRPRPEVLRPLRLPHPDPALVSLAAESAAY
ncbi:hypothetical protein Agub_g9024, partial [Astrephomene gubernaculifera]